MSLLVASLLCLKELLRLRKQDTDETNSDRESSTNPEDRLPGVGSSTNTQVGTGSENVTEGVTLLQDTAHKTTSVGSRFVSGFDWRGFRVMLTGSSQVPWRWRFRTHLP